MDGTYWIGGYRVVRQLGAGGMGAVFEAVQPQIERRVAIKMLLPELARDPGVAQRFLNEARAANLVGHPGIVQVYEHGQLPDGTPYIVMEFLTGETLGDRLARCGRLAPVETARIGRQVFAALAAAHARGIIHRDLKPDNVMLVPDPETPSGERVKLLDFGIAKFAADLRASDSDHLRTRTGVLLGTPLYMSPEQCRGAGTVDDRADVYSAGVMLYQMLSGWTPFDAEALGELIFQQISMQPRALRSLDPTIPEALATVIHAMLAKDPQGRPSAVQGVAALEDYLRAQGVPVTGPGVSGTLVGPSGNAPGGPWRGTSSPATASTAGTRLTATGWTPPPVTPAPAPAARGPNPRMVLALGALALPVLLCTAGVGLTVLRSRAEQRGEALARGVARRATPPSGGEPTAATAPAPDELLAAKVRPYAAHCLDRFSERVLASRDRYLQWADPARGPTGNEAQVDGLHEVSGDPDECAGVVAQGRETRPPLPDLDAAGERYAAALRAVLPRIAQAFPYYDRRNYRDDHMALGRQMHPALAQGFADFAQADRALAERVGAYQDQAADALVARLQADPARRMEYLVENDQRMARRLARMAAAAQIDDAGRLTGVAGATLLPLVDTYELGVDEMVRHARLHPEQAAAMQNLSGYEDASNDYLRAVRNLARRVREGRPFDRDDLRVIRQLRMGYSIEGSPDAVARAYSALATRYDFIR